MLPIMTSKAADDESPEPLKTFDVMQTSNPPTANPRSLNPRHIPAIKASDVVKFSAIGEIYLEKSTEISSNPSLFT